MGITRKPFTGEKEFKPLRERSLSVQANGLPGLQMINLLLRKTVQLEISPGGNTILHLVRLISTAFLTRCGNFWLEKISSSRMA